MKTADDSIDAGSTPILFGNATYRGSTGRDETVQVLRAEQWIPRDINEVFNYFRDERNLQNLTPEFLSFKVEGKNTPEMGEGTLIDYQLRVHGIPIRWQTEIRNWKPPYEFSDFQLKGPYRLWHHFHHFVEKDGGTLIKDEVFFSLPLGRVGHIFGGWFVRRDVRAIFEYRQNKISGLFRK